MSSAKRLIALTMAVAAIFTLAMPARPAATAERCMAASVVGTRLPVVLIHGYTGSKRDWEEGGPASMVQVLRSVPNIKVENFDYSATNRYWVDHPNIGPRFAREIECLASSSRQAGGPGKVVVVAHSMGGLATRYAASRTMGGHKVSQDLGLVVTIGTPNIGSGLATLGSTVKRFVCTPSVIGFRPRVSGNSPCALDVLYGLATYSSQIDDLPWLPSSVSVLALAGYLTLTFPVFHASFQKTEGDPIVSKHSALLGVRAKRPGSGLGVSTCKGSILTFTHSSCYHSNLPHNKQVTAATVEAIRKYQASLSFGKYAGRWDVHGTVLRINANRAGELAWNAGSCGEPIAGVNCNGIAQLRFVSTGNGIRGTITSIRYQPWTDDPLPPDFTLPTGGYQVGDALSFRLIAPGVLQRTAGPPGNPYYCAEQASEEWHSKCNAWRGAADRCHNRIVCRESGTLRPKATKYHSPLHFTLQTCVHERVDRCL